MGLALLASGSQFGTGGMQDVGGPFNSQRPTFSGTPFSLPQGVLQFEAGATFQQGDGDETLLRFPELLLRYGLSGGLEAQLGFPDYFVFNNGFDAEGWGGAMIAVKFQIAGAPSGFTAALRPRMSIDTDGLFSPTQNRFGLDIPWIYSAPGMQRPLFGSVTFNDEENDDIFGINVGINLDQMSGWMPFIEYGGAFQKNFAPSHLLHFGGQRLQGNGAFDIHFGFGLTKNAPDWFIGAGFVGRL